MDRDQRVDDNAALLAAQALATAEKQPLIVAVVLTAATMSSRQYLFVLQGLMQIEPRLAEKNIAFVVLLGDPIIVLSEFIKKQKMGAVVMDFSPLRQQRVWRDGLAAATAVECREVDAHNIVPAWIASQKKETSAASIRIRLQALLPSYLEEYEGLDEHPIKAPTCPMNDWAAIAGELGISLSDKPLRESGVVAAHKVLALFIKDRLENYPVDRNIATRQGQSGLSPYLHFGQISPQRVALEVNKAVDAEAALSHPRDIFFEGLIYRRELADNFCLNEPYYDAVKSFPIWAKDAFKQRFLDIRPHLTSPQEFESAKTHDALWNACQTELVKRGHVSGFLRVYWAKKILEWSSSPEEALSIATTLNDRYALDGNDPNGYAGIAWSIGGVHDKPAIDRPIFGQVRYMNLNECKKKFNIEAYIHKATKDV